MTTYRLVRWVPLSGDLDGFKFRKALTAMSVGGLTSDQLREATGLRRTEVASLLKALTTAGALEIEPPLIIPAPDALKLAERCDIDLPLDPCDQAWTRRDARGAGLAMKLRAVG